MITLELLVPAANQRSHVFFQTGRLADSRSPLFPASERHPDNHSQPVTCFHIAALYTISPLDMHSLCLFDTEFFFSFSAIFILSTLSISHPKQKPVLALSSRANSLPDDLPIIPFPFPSEFYTICQFPFVVHICQSSHSITSTLKKSRWRKSDRRSRARYR